MTYNANKGVCIFLLIVCAALWVFAPFSAVNLITVGNQPTALELITDDVTAIGDLTDTPAFLAAAASAVAIIACFIAFLANGTVFPGIMALLAEVCMAWGVYQMIDSRLSDYLFNWFGWGFWAIFILLPVTAICSFTGRRSS